MPATSLLITAQKMRREQEAGRVRDLHPDIREFRKYYGSWWVQSADPPGWLRVTDAWIASRLDRIKTRLDIAEDDRAAEQAMRDNALHQEDPGCLIPPAPRSPAYPTTTPSMTQPAASEVAGARQS